VRPTSVEDGTHPVPPASAIPGRDTFWMTATGTLLRAPDAAVARALASEWASTDAAAGAAGRVFGPVRLRQSWFVAAQAPIELRAANGSRPAATRPCLRKSDALLLRAHFGRLVNEGYDFELSQRVAATHTRSAPAPRRTTDCP